MTKRIISLIFTAKFITFARTVCWETVFVLQCCDFRHVCKRWRKKNSSTLETVMPIPMFVKYVLNLQLLLFFFHADIFVVSIFNRCLKLFPSDSWHFFCKNTNSLLFALAVCKSCSLACSECPICRTNITDRLFAFTWPY